MGTKATKTTSLHPSVKSTTEKSSSSTTKSKPAFSKASSTTTSMTKDTPASTRTRTTKKTVNPITKTITATTQTKRNPTSTVKITRENENESRYVTTLLASLSGWKIRHFIPLVLFYSAERIKRLHPDICNIEVCSVPIRPTTPAPTTTTTIPATTVPAPVNASFFPGIVFVLILIFSNWH